MNKTEWFIQRTSNHIALVEKYYKLLTNKDLIDHDKSKLQEPEYTPYVEITWDYHCKDLGVENSLPESIKDLMNEATLHHITHNKHHPEYWDSNFDSSMLNRDNRDEVPANMVDATTMPDEAIYEMCADWLAMSEEKNTNPLDWAEKNVNKKWKFTEEQVKLIYDCLGQY